MSVINLLICSSGVGGRSDARVTDDRRIDRFHAFAPLGWGSFH
jgi:hypothetical protein